ncbi:MAG: excinuclease ABC subunit UvrC [Opitutales bacterium]
MSGRPDTKSRIKEKVRRLAQTPGVYLMKDRFGQVIYVGKAKNLKKRVSTYFQASRKTLIAQPKVRAMIPLIHDFETIEVKSEAEALLLEGRLIKQYKPRYNTDFTDDKRFLLVRVDMAEPLPRFRLSRNRKEDGARYFGPFARAGLLRQTLARMRTKFGILLGDAAPREIRPGVWQLYDDVRREIYGHENEVTPEQYRERVEAACVFLEGKQQEWLEELEAEMREAAQQQQFERAAELRDAVLALRKTLHRTRKFERNVPQGHENLSETLERLQEKLSLRQPPERMECFDISHISGTYCVASMVHFRDGKPDKNQYRRFKIRSFIGNDDFRAMEEVVGRRYRRLHEEGRPPPDLVVIDGGAGQVNAALKAFLVLDLEPPPLIGLAKRQETILFADGRPPLNLSLHDPALRLLQRLRDEAHRFANSFNADLRSRKLRESVLDDFPGLGPVLRKSLMNRFRTLDRLKKASAEEIASVEGFGPIRAEKLKTFLDQHTRQPS